MTTINNNNTHERWADIAGYEGLYQVSDQGRVARLVRNKDGKLQRRLVEQFETKYGGHSYVRKNGERVFYQQKRSTPYKQVFLSKYGVKMGFYVHRLVLTAFAGAPLPFCECDHKDNNPGNNRLENLHWVTRAENHAKRRPCGTANFICHSTIIVNPTPKSHGK